MALAGGAEGAMGIVQVLASDFSTAQCYLCNGALEQRPVAA